jgi:tetratricopeptide (TPR) repeat protein
MLLTGCVVSSLLALQGDPPAPTWSRDVAPILFEHCATCHRPGETGPFPLLDAQDAADHAEQIADVTRTRYMPPWLAAPGELPFVGVRRLTDEQIATLERWAKAGAPAGDPALAPPLPKFTPGWQLGVPDLVVTMPQPYVLPAGGLDRYRNFVIPVPVTTMKYVRAVELRPGNPRVVHHAVIKLDKGDSSRRLDAKDPEPGFDEMDAGEAVSPDGQFLGWTPGRVPRPLSDGMSWRLPPDSDLVVQLHLLPSGRPEPVQVSVGLFFTDSPPRRLPFLLRLGCQAIDLPAGDAAYAIEDRFTLPAPAELQAILPHAHFLGKSVSVAATFPDGSTKSLLDIPRWDFSWQDEFRLEKTLPLPAGTTLSMRWVYDNSEGNPRNPRRPPQRVRFGPSSLEEMCDVWIQVVPAGRADFESLQRAFNTKDLAMLRAGFEMKLADQPDDADTHLHLGLTLAQQGDADGARREITRTLELAPAHARARFHLALLLEQAQETAAARAELQRVVALEPDHAPALVELGLLAESSGANDEARTWLERAVAARPRLSSARIELGRLLDLTGADQAAGEQYEAALALEPNAADVRRVLAWLRATSPIDAARDGNAALDLARTLVQSHPDDPLELDVLAAAQAESGRFKAAADTAARAIDLAQKRGATTFASAVSERRALYLRNQPYRESQSSSR